MKIITLVLIMITTISLAGCGGGSSNRRGNDFVTIPYANPVARNRMRTIAATAPVQGSATQSSISNATTSVSIIPDSDKPDSDKITVEISGISNDIAGFSDNVKTEGESTIGKLVFDAGDLKRTEPNKDNKFMCGSSKCTTEEMYFEQTTTGGYRTVEVKHGGRFGVAVRKINYSSTNYLTLGAWLYRPNHKDDIATGNNQLQYGVYADGNDPFTQANVAGLMGTATYEGKAYADYVTSKGMSQVTGELSLMANFGDATARGAISGTISEMKMADKSIKGSVNLGDANIGDFEGGFFTGDTTYTLDGKSYAGKWGGSFYGNSTVVTDKPAAVAGTFGAATPDTTDKMDGASLTGYFYGKLK